LRLRFDGGRAAVGDVRAQIARALSRGMPASVAAAWIDGLLRGSGVMLVHHPELLDIVDEWLVALSAQTFLETLPLVRRTFATFEQPERRAMGERIAAARSGGAAAVDGDVDWERARVVLPVLTAILGAEAPT
jgi:hypothetical protein